MWSLPALKLGCLLALALLPLLCGLLTVLLFRLGGAAAGRGLCRSGRSTVSCAAGGVFLAACLLDVVPDSLADLRDELRRQNLSQELFPVPEFVLALGFLLILVLEHVALDCGERQRDEASLPLLASSAHLGPGQATAGEQHIEAGVSRCPGAGDARPSSASSSFRALILILSLSLHSVFEGLAVGLQETESRVVQLAVAILLHKSLMAVGLALLLLQSCMALAWLAASLACFALMSPLGVGMGMAVTHSSGTGTAVARSVLEGVAAGTFMYITFVEILPRELSSPSPSSRLPKVLALLLGFAGMAGLRLLG